MSKRHLLWHVNYIRYLYLQRKASIFNTWAVYHLLDWGTSPEVVSHLSAFITFVAHVPFLGQDSGWPWSLSLKSTISRQPDYKTVDDLINNFNTANNRYNEIIITRQSPVCCQICCGSLLSSSLVQAGLAMSWNHGVNLLRTQNSSDWPINFTMLLCSCNASICWRKKYKSDCFTLDSKFTRGARLCALMSILGAPRRVSMQKQGQRCQNLKSVF